MAYGKISDKEFDVIRDASGHSNTVVRYASKLTGWLSSLLNGDYPAEAWGTAFVPQDDGLQAQLTSPFGEARVIVVLGLGSDGVQARYIFEKKCRSETGDPVYLRVWAVRITTSGIVKTDDEKNVIVDMNAFSRSERDNGAVAIALSALYAIAKCDSYWSPVAEE